jgi:cytoskeletal protein CcmA (bactofilin family)
MKYKLLFAGLFVAMFSSFGVYKVASAQSIRSSDNINVASDQKIDSSVYYAGSSIDIAGTINGDVYCVAQTLNISGTINGDVICAAQSVNITGEVDGSLRVAAQTINISGQTKGNSTVFSQSANLIDGAKIGRDLNGASTQLIINQGALVARDVTIGAEIMNINGQIGRNAEVAVENLSLGPESKIKGNLTYYSNKDVSKQQGAEIAGSVTKKVPDASKNRNLLVSPFASILFGLFILGSMLLTSLVLVLIFPKVFKDTVKSSDKKTGKSIILGSISLFLMPIVIIFLLITVIGIPLAILLLLGWSIIMFLSGPFFAYYVGSKLINNNNAILIMLAGSVVLLILYAIPVINFLALLAAGIFGSGIILNQLSMKYVKPKYTK